MCNQAGNTKAAVLGPVPTPLYAEQSRIARGTHAAFMKEKGIWDVAEARHFERCGKLPSEEASATS